MNLVEQVTEQVRKEIEQGILQAKADGRFDFTEMPAFIVEVPKDKSHGAKVHILSDSRCSANYFLYLTSIKF